MTTQINNINYQKNIFVSFLAIIQSSCYSNYKFLYWLWLTYRFKDNHEALCSFRIQHIKNSITLPEKHILLPVHRISSNRGFGFYPISNNFGPTPIRGQLVFKNLRFLEEGKVFCKASSWMKTQWWTLHSYF